MNEELLLKYITGQATEGEKITILNWLEEHPDNRLKFNRLKNTWVISKLPETKAPEASVLQYSRKTATVNKTGESWVMALPLH